MHTASINCSTHDLYKWWMEETGNIVNLFMKNGFLVYRSHLQFSKTLIAMQLGLDLFGESGAIQKHIGIGR